ncbi:hypothetical protein COY95_05260 [Candidatus Woesearchaeota archaeon CG_4_10_14_0_8_um_filter_47_5]|nr:MAG: hypothetical protein COY95_05260 [Candidatus Woesearchaeota archaeon CG_4_10_14_0_8_um_filter_47_5]
MILTWLGLAGSLGVVVAGAASGGLGIAFGALEAWKHHKDYNLDTRIRPGALNHQKESYAGTDRRQGMKYELESRRGW